MKGVNFKFQDFLCHGDGICNDDDNMDVIYLHGWYKASVNGHEFGLYRCHIYGVDLKVLDNRIVGPDMSDCCGDMGFLNTSICNDSNVVG